jgi:hypothetical protein
METQGVYEVPASGSELMEYLPVSKLGEVNLKSRARRVT